MSSVVCVPARSQYPKSARADVGTRSGAVSEHECRSDALHSQCINGADEENTSPYVFEMCDEGMGSEGGFGSFYVVYHVPGADQTLVRSEAFDSEDPYEISSCRRPGAQGGRRSRDRLLIWLPSCMASRALCLEDDSGLGGDRQLIFCRSDVEEDPCSRETIDTVAAFSGCNFRVCY